MAECGGFLYLNRLLSDGEGRDWPMAGALPGRAANTGKLGRFGYVTLTAKKDGLLGPAGTRLPAHEFHYWDSDAPGERLPGGQAPEQPGVGLRVPHPDAVRRLSPLPLLGRAVGGPQFCGGGRRYVQEASL